MGTLPKDVLDTPAAAKAAGLVYVTDAKPGIRRRRRGRGFTYVGPDGKRPEPEALKRIHELVIPPAWQDVWVCAHSRGHIQATGRDQRGRKQYLYHSKWREVRDATKFHRMIEFGEGLPALRRAVRRYLSQDELSREKVIALAIKLMESTAIRIGNDEYAKKNGSYGLTTLTTRHVRVNGKNLHFRFEAKGGKIREVEITDSHLAKMVKQCMDLPGYELFQYQSNGGDARTLDSGEFNEFLQEVMGGYFTAKDFRTWTATVLATSYLIRQGPRNSFGTRKVVVRDAIRGVSEHLGNTQATCRKYYIHPFVLNAYLDGSLLEILGRRKVRRRWRSLRSDEQATLKLLLEGEQSGRAAEPLQL